MKNNEIIRTTCGICNIACGALAHVSDGKVVQIEGDPDCPINNGELCIKGQASLEVLYHPDRLKHPLKRMGKRGDGKWQQISWSEALDIVVNEFSKAKEKFGPESVVFMRGAMKGHQDNWVQRFASVFGSPNVSSSRNVCDTPRIEASLLTCGFFPYPDYEYPPSCLVIWGSNTAESHPDQYRRTIEAVATGTRLIVIDPKGIYFTPDADHWLRLRPGSDLALALGMLNVIISENLYDKDFVENWTTGFNELKTHVQDYPPEKVSRITWIDAEKIKEVARVYAGSKAACIEWANGLDQNLNSVQTGRAILILRAITGNLDVPGGDLQRMQPPTLGRFSPKLTLVDKMPSAQRENSVGQDFKVLANVWEVPQPKVVEAIITEKPYPIRSAYNMGCNALLTYSNVQEVYGALKKLDFHVAAEMFMTPTAALADLVLPVAGYLEFDNLTGSARHGIIRVQQKVTEVGECWSDYKILCELAKKMGMGEYFWDNEEQALDATLEPTGLTFEEFRKIGAISGTMQYRKYKLNGFNTPSGKVELYSSRLEAWGYDPLPTYVELPETPYSNPELTEEYPLIYVSGKSLSYRHASGRQIATLRESHPDPIVKIHPETAKNLGIRPGDSVYIETKRGRIKQKAALTDRLDPRVVDIDFGWWFPEKGIGELFDWKSANINILTDNKPPYSRELGTVNSRGISCKVYKA